MCEAAVFLDRKTNWKSHGRRGGAEAGGGAPLVDVFGDRSWYRRG